MAIIQNINVSTPNDNQGDTLRDSQVKANQNFAELNNKKVEQVSGKGLSDNNLTNTLKSKLDGIEDGAQVNVQPDWEQTDITADDFIQNKPNLEERVFSAVGGFDYQDAATSTTPLAYTSGDLQLTNDTLGANNYINQPPYGVSSVWDAATNTFIFSELSIGDEVFLRVHINITIAAARKSGLKLLLGEGTANEYTLPIDLNIENSSSGTHEIIKSVHFTMKYEDWRLEPIKLLFESDGALNIEIVGFHPYIIRKSVNILDVNDDNYKTFTIRNIEENIDDTVIDNGDIKLGYNGTNNKINVILLDAAYSSYVTNYKALDNIYYFSLNFVDKTNGKSYTSFITDFELIGSRYKLTVDETLFHTDFAINDKVELFINAARIGDTDLPPIKEVYPSITELLSDQTNQLANYIYEVTDASGFTGINTGSAWVRYKGTIVGDETDYVVISKSDVDVDLSSKEDSIVADGLVTSFWSGLKTFRNLATDVRAVLLTGLSTATNSVITATDSILVAFGKLQAQVSNRWSLTGNAGTNPTTDFIGTTDAQDFVVRTNGFDRGVFGSTTLATDSNFRLVTTNKSLTLRNTETFSSIQSGNGNDFIFRYGNNLVIRKNNNTEVMRITDGGLVGIGNSSPYEKLTVNGRIALNPQAIAGGNNSIRNDGNDMLYKDNVGVEHRLLKSSLIDTAWTLIPPTSNFSGTLEYRRINDRLKIRGNIQVLSVFGASSVCSLFDLPIGFRLNNINYSHSFVVTNNNQDQGGVVGEIKQGRYLSIYNGVVVNSFYQVNTEVILDN